MTSAVLFQISPYAAIIIFTGGMVVRYLMTRKRPPGRAPSLHHKGTLSSGVRFLEVSLFSLLLGHIGGLLFPQWLIQWNSAAVRLYMLEALAFGFGILALVGWALAMWQQAVDILDELRHPDADEIRAKLH